MVIDKQDILDFIIASFPKEKVEITTFDSGSFMIDVFRSNDSVNIQYGLTFLGVSVTQNDDIASGFCLSDNIFQAVDDFKKYILSEVITNHSC